MSRWLLAFCGLALLPVAALAQFSVPANLGIVGHVFSAASTTWNPADKGTNIALSNGNLTMSSGTSMAWQAARTIANESSGKWYVEVTLAGGSNWILGMCDGSANINSFVGSDVHGFGYSPSNGIVVNNGGQVATYATASQGQIIGVAADFGAKLIWWRVAAGNWNNSGAADPATGTGGLSTATGPVAPFFMCGSVFDGGDMLTANFGATAMSFTPPAGYTVGFH